MLVSRKLIQCFISHYIFFSFWHYLSYFLRGVIKLKNISNSLIFNDPLNIIHGPKLGGDRLEMLLQYYEYFFKANISERY